MTHNMHLCQLALLSKPLAAKGMRILWGYLQSNPPTSFLALWPRASAHTTLTCLGKSLHSQSQRFRNMNKRERQRKFKTTFFLWFTHNVQLDKCMVVVCLFVCFCVGKELSFSKISRSHQMVPGCPKSTNCPLTGLPSVTWIVLREELPSVTELLATVYYHHLCQILLCWTIAVSNNKESKYF